MAGGLDTGKWVSVPPMVAGKYKCNRTAYSLEEDYVQTVYQVVEDHKARGMVAASTAPDEPMEEEQVVEGKEKKGEEEEGKEEEDKEEEDKEEEGKEEEGKEEEGKEEQGKKEGFSTEELAPATKQVVMP